MKTKLLRKLRKNLGVTFDGKYYHFHENKINNKVYHYDTGQFAILLDHYHDIILNYTNFQYIKNKKRLRKNKILF